MDYKELKEKEIMFASIRVLSKFSIFHPWTEASLVVCNCLHTMSIAVQWFVTWCVGEMGTTTQDSVCEWFENRPIDTELGWRPQHQHKSKGPLCCATWLNKGAGHLTKTVSIPVTMRCVLLAERGPVHDNNGNVTKTGCHAKWSSVS